MTKKGALDDHQRSHDTEYGGPHDVIDLLRKQASRLLHCECKCGWPPYLLPSLFVDEQVIFG